MRSTSVASYFCVQCFFFQVRLREPLRLCEHLVNPSTNPNNPYTSPQSQTKYCSHSPRSSLTRKKIYLRTQLRSLHIHLALQNYNKLLCYQLRLIIATPTQFISFDACMQKRVDVVKPWNQARVRFPNFGNHYLGKEQQRNWPGYIYIFPNRNDTPTLSLIVCHIFILMHISY